MEEDRKKRNSIMKWISEAKPGIYPISKPEAIPVIEMYIDIRNRFSCVVPEVEMNSDKTKIRVYPLKK